MSAPAEDANATPPSSDTPARSDTSGSRNNGTHGESRRRRGRGSRYRQRSNKTGSSTATMLISKVRVVIGTNAENSGRSFDMP